MILNGEPVTSQILEGIEEVEVTLDDYGRSGFQFAIVATRSEIQSNRFDQLIAVVPQQEQRLVMSVTFDTDPVVLIDGLIIHQELLFDESGESAVIVITGEDISIMLDVEEKIKEFATQDEAAIVGEILRDYENYFSAKVVPPDTVITPIQDVYLPIQRCTDRVYIEYLAKRYNHRVYVNFKSPKSEFYWGPLVETGGQPDLLFAPNQFVNVLSLNITYNALAATKYIASIQDRSTDVISPIDVETATSEAGSLTTSPAISKQALVRKVLSTEVDGRLQTEAQAWAQGAVNASTSVAIIEGELDSARYGQPLQPRSSVKLRGAHSAYDGDYYVQKVTHIIKPNSYRQRFVLTREGIDSASG
jgi:hypothetical protein